MYNVILLATAMVITGGIVVFTPLFMNCSPRTERITKNIGALLMICGVLIMLFFGEI